LSRSAELPSLAAKLESLFQRRPGRPYTNQEVSEGIRAQAGPDGTTVSASLLQQLRSGAKTNPTVNTVEAIAAFFGVPASHFLSSAADGVLPEERALLETMRDNDVRAVALRANGLSPDSLRMVIGVIEQARRLEQLDEKDRSDT
jgi:transcriptional regulator with XRE-family HTH domain